MEVNVLRGTLEVSLQRGDYLYVLTTQRAVTLIRESDFLSKDGEVYMSECPCYFVDDDWRETLPVVENSFIVADDSTDFLDSLDSDLLASIHSGSNRYIIISKKPLLELQCSIHEVYAWSQSRLLENTFELRHTHWNVEEFNISFYNKYNNVVLLPTSITEQAVYSLIFPQAIMCDTIGEFISEMEAASESGNIFIATGSILGVHLDTIVDNLKSNALWLPESFEWLVLEAICRLHKFTYDIKSLALKESEGNWFEFFRFYLERLAAGILHITPYRRDEIPMWLLPGKILDSLASRIHEVF